MTNKLRWTQHPESSVLLQLEFNNCGLWYTIEGTTTHSLNDAGKFVLMDIHAKRLGFK